MRKGTLVSAALHAIVVLVVAAAALAAGDADLDKAKSLLQKAEPFAARGDDPDLEDGERKEARKEARKLLREARDAYQAWQSANPDREDSVGPEIAKLLYWVNKMSSISEVSPGGGSAPPKPVPPKPDTPPAPGPGSGAAPGNGGAPATPPAPPAPPDPGQQAKTDYAALLEFEKTHKSDVPALRDAFEKFLADHPDTTLPEYTKAALRLGQLTEELNATFKKVVQRDPEALDNTSDSAATPAVMARLRRDLNGKDPEARRNAAKLLGLTRSGAASFPLVAVLRDSDPEVAKLAAEALVQIGGTRTAQNLTKEFRDRSHDSQVIAVDVLEQIAKKGPVDARAMSPWLGRFVLSNDDQIAQRALDILVSLGQDGGPGLVDAMETRMVDKKLVIMESIGKVKYMPGAARMANCLLRGDGADVEVPRKKAMDTITSMGIHTIPYLYKALADPRTRQWTGYMLQQMTGARIASNDVAGWKEWYQANKNQKQR